MQRCEFFSFHQRKLVDEVDEVLEACVEMRLCRQQHDVLEVSVVDVSIHSEQSLEDHFDDCFEIARKWYSKGTGENLLVIELVLNPRHQEVDIFSS